MRCPFCSADKESLKVIDSRTCENGRSIRRRRECLHCEKRFTTYERVEQVTRLMVVKKDGRRVPWDREKILGGLERACFKRPIPEIELIRVVDEVEEEIKAGYDREVPSAAIGQLVIDKLRRLDQVAYVRFASVHRQFKTLEELVGEAQAVIDARRYEDPPGQGRLFVEPPGQARAANGEEHETKNGAEAPRPSSEKGPRQTSTRSVGSSRRAPAAS